jgi:hypothetical protein
MVDECITGLSEREATQDADGVVGADRARTHVVE